MQLHNHEQKVNTKQLFKISEALFQKHCEPLNYSNATNHNEHAFQLLFVPRWKALFLAFLTYPLYICWFECENNAQLFKSTR